MEINKDIDVEKANAEVSDNLEENSISDDYLDKARSAFMSADEYFNANIRRNMEDSVRQFNSQHLHGSKYLTDSFRYKSKLFKPKSRSIVRNHEAVLNAALFSTMDILNISAVDNDDESQNDSAKFYTELMNHRLNKDIPWYQLCVGAYQDAMVYGISISKQYWDFTENKPCVELIAPENFRFDPSCNWVDPVKSSPYIIEMIPMYVHEVRRKIREDGWNEVSDKELRSARKQSFDSIRVTREKDRLDPKDRPNNISDYDIVWVHLNIMAKEDGSGDVAFYTLGVQAMLTEPVEISEMFLNGQRPYVIGKCIVEAHKNYPTSLMDLTRDLQKEQNDIINQRMDNVKLAMDKRYFVKKGQQVDITSMKLNTPGSVTFLNDPQKDIQIVSTPDVTNTSYQEINLLNLDFDALVGGFDGSTVQANRSLNETVGGMNLLSSHANQVTEFQIKVFVETWVTPVLYQLLHLEQAYETDLTIMALAGKKSGVINKYGIDGIVDQLLVQDLTMRVSVGMGATNPATKNEKFMMAITSLLKVMPQFADKLNMQEVTKEIFGNLGYDNGSRFVNFESDEEDPRIAEMQQQIQMLQQQLQAKKPQELIDAEVNLKKAQAVKTYTEAAFGAMQAGEVVAQMPSVAQVADVVMASSGFIPQAGQDPNYPAPMVDEETLARARKESDNLDFKKNNNPLTPKTPNSGFNKGIETKESDS
jgi:hypothetical protein